MSAAISGTALPRGWNPGCRFAHPGYKQLPKPWHGRLEPAPDPHRGDAQREARDVIRFHRDTAQRGGATRRLESARWNAGDEAVQRLVLVHADHRIIVAGH